MQMTLLTGSSSFRPSMQVQMQVLQYLSVICALLLGLGLLALDSCKGGVGPYQIDSVLALILNNHLLAEAMT